jgi:hypothetical protein
LSHDHFFERSMLCRHHSRRCDDCLRGKRHDSCEWPCVACNSALTWRLQCAAPRRAWINYSALIHRNKQPHNQLMTA